MTIGDVPYPVPTEAGTLLGIPEGLLRMAAKAVICDFSLVLGIPEGLLRMAAKATVRLSVICDFSLVLGIPEGPLRVAAVTDPLLAWRLRRIRATLGEPIGALGSFELPRTMVRDFSLVLGTPGGLLRMAAKATVRLSVICDFSLVLGI